MATIWLVEDDQNIRELVAYALEAAGLEVYTLEDGAALRSALLPRVPDLLLLDIMLPGEDGLSILRELKQGARTRALPVILLTAKGAELDRVRGLDLGADDYITKPFSVLELTARVKALLRRSVSDLPKPLACGAIMLDVLRHTVTVHGMPVTLTYKEFELLHLLLQNAGLVLTREQMMIRVWGFDFEGESRTVDVHIMALRQKLGVAGEAIQTIRGVGYKLEADT